MKTNEIKIPTLKFNSDIFVCPRCGWESPPMLVKGDVAPNTACKRCGHSYLVRKK